MASTAWHGGHWLRSSRGSDAAVGVSNAGKSAVDDTEACSGAKKRALTMLHKVLNYQFKSDELKHLNRRVGLDGIHLADAGAQTDLSQANCIVMPIVSQHTSAKDVLDNTVMKTANPKPPVTCPSLPPSAFFDQQKWWTGDQTVLPEAGSHTLDNILPDYSSGDEDEVDASPALDICVVPDDDDIADQMRSTRLARVYKAAQIKAYISQLDAGVFHGLDAPT